MRLSDFKNIIILGAAIVLAALFFSARSEGFESSGVYTLLGIQLQNANVDSFLKSTTGYSSMFATIKDMNGKLIWTKGSLIETGPATQTVIVYLNPQPPTSLSDLQGYVSNLRTNINNAYGSPVISQFILSLPNGTFVNEKGEPVITQSNTFIMAIGVILILVAIYFIFIRGFKPDVIR